MTTTEAAEGDDHDPPDECFDEFYRRMFPVLVRRAIMRGLDQDDAFDATQNALVGVCRHWARLSSQSETDRQRYLATALRNSVVDVWRQRGDDRRVSAELRQQRPQVVTFDEDPVLRTGELDLVRGLPERPREVILLVADGWKSGEIATILGIDPSTVRSQLQRARKALKGMTRSRIEGEDEG